ncbi:MAG: FAD-dependent oxidoreductase [Dehalococcoidia bacterium]|nr:FAD-dependent oxidoreductase [Dehalococcoidia bacterium]
MAQLKKLFEPGKIGSLEIKNRLVMAPMGSHSCDADGFVTDKTLQYYGARAKGGVGLIVVQATTVSKGSDTPHGMRLHDDKFIPGMKKLSSAIHQGGAKAVVQLNHHGRIFSKVRRSVSPNPEEVEVIGPSAIPSITDGVIPREMTKTDIKSMVAAFAECSQRAKDAGFDGVEIHAAHGYLLGSFLSPLTNHRQDEYGGSLENKARFVCEVLRATRSKVGPNFALIVRVSGMELLEGGIRIEDVVLHAPMFVKAGADAIHVSGGTTDYPVRPSYLKPNGLLAGMAQAVKRVVKVPVITVGKIGSPVLAERILEDGKADFVAMGRPLLADPELPNKAKEGRTQDINHCIFCNNCYVLLFAGGGVSDFTCTVNPYLFAEDGSELKPAKSPKKIMVVGGGLAGMLAARDLAQRGHQVTLYEKSDRLGGQWNIVCLEQKGFAMFSGYLKRGLMKTNAKIVLSKDVTLEFVKESRPDVVVVATGASPAKPDVPGAMGKNVVQAVDVITGKAQVGDRVVVIGGRHVGMQMALSLAKQGKRVTLTTRGDLGRDVEMGIYIVLRDELAERGVPMFTHAPVSEIRETGVYVTHQNRPLFLRADTVVLAAGSKPENELAEQLKGVVAELHVIGDCAQPRTAIHATTEAARVARQI